MALLNTNTVFVGLDTDLNQAPYWDDFDETKNFYRHLAVPGRALQGREFTQIQTMLQNQLDRLGSHLFKEGSRVKGGEFVIDTDLDYVKVRDNDTFGNTVTISNFDGTLMTSPTTGVQAIVIDVADGTEAEAPDMKTLFVKYTSSGTSNNELGTFLVGEQLTSNNGFSCNVSSNSTPIGKGSRFTFRQGVVYAKDHFISHPDLNILLDKYSQSPSYKVGYRVREEIVTENDDTTLNDIALGTPNETAPGCHRLKLTLSPEKIAPTNTNPTGFFELVRLKNGVIQELYERTQYNDLADELAKRTYDESGDYVVRGLNVRVREHINSGNNQGLYYANNGGDSTKILYGIQPGVGYVKGYEYETYVTKYVVGDKGTDYKDVEQVQVTPNYGNYTLVHEVAGTWNINTGTVIDLYDTAQNNVSDMDYSTVAVAGSKIGEARFRNILHESGSQGTSSAQYRIYLYDISFTGNNNFSDVRAIYYNNTSTSDSYADTVLTGGSATLNEINFVVPIYPLPTVYTRSLRDENDLVDTTYAFIKSFPVTIATDGTFSVSTGLSDETFIGSVGALNATQKNENFIVSLDQGVTTADLTGTVQFTAASNTVTGTSTAFDTELNVGDKLVRGATGPVRIVAIANSTQLTVSPQPGSTTNGTYRKDYEAGEIIDFTGDGVDGARTITLASTTVSNFDLNETLANTATATVHTRLSKVDGQETRKVLRPSRYVVIDTSNNAANTVGPWCLGFSDAWRVEEVRWKASAFANTTEGSLVSSQYELDNGQKDNRYGLSYLSKKAAGGLTSGDNLLVKMSYFYHDTSQGVGYLSVDSYPIDDADASNTTAIFTWEIPKYRSIQTGRNYNLRDCVDTRYKVADTSTDATTLVAATVNPSNTESYTVPSGGLHTMAVNEPMSIDESYYLSRKDIITLNRFGAFGIVKGIPSSLPVTPQVPKDSMALAVITVAPYPTLSHSQAQSVGRKELACDVLKVSNRRYTMRDIGKLDKRLTNMEYYVSLNALEKNTEAMVILDSNGLDRFKNGIIVDPFKGHNVGDTENIDYKCSIDPAKTLLRPRFDIYDIDLELTTNVNVIYTSPDVRLTVGSLTNFSNGEQVYQGASYATATATGYLRFATATNRLYVETVSGTFSAGINTKGNSSGASTSTANVQSHAPGKLLTLPYSQEILVDQPFASTTRNSSGLFWNWSGYLTLNPDNDHWVDTVTLPDVVVNEESVIVGESVQTGDLNDGWYQAPLNWGGEYEGWVFRWVGGDTRFWRLATNPNNLTEDDFVRALYSSENAREFFRYLNVNRVLTEQSRISSETVTTETEVIGESITDVSIIPFIRSRRLNFTAHAIKPNTRVYPFFDGEDVSAYVRPTTYNFSPTGTWGDPLVTSASGRLWGQFRIPNNNTLRFPVGQRIFRVSDSVTNSTTIGQYTTQAQDEYNASGLRQERQRLVRQTTTTELEFDRVWIHDPVAQSFTVDLDPNLPGCYLTKVDLYFQTKDTTLPVIIEVHEMDNSVTVSERIVQYSQTIVYPDDINTSADATVPTPIYFPSPIFVRNGTDYAIVIKPGANNPNYALWVSQLGETDITTGGQITKQPYSGLLFVASNETSFTPIQEEDIKFTLYRADFTEFSGTATFNNKDFEFFTVSNVSSSLTAVNEPVFGETRLTLGTLSGTANVAEIIRGVTSNATGQITNINGSVYRVRDVAIDNKFIDLEGVTFEYAANGSTTGATANVASQTTPNGQMLLYDNRDVDNIILHLNEPNGNFVVGEQLTDQTGGKTMWTTSVDDLQLNNLTPLIDDLIFPTAYINYGVRTTSNAHTLETTWTDVTNRTPYEFDTERAVLGKTAQTADLAGSKSYWLRGIFLTSNSVISPSLDLSRLGSVIVGNQINNDATGEDGTSGGNALARYISKRVQLEAITEDFKIFITASRPAVTGVNIYVKLAHDEDDTPFDEQSWIQLSPEDAEVPTSSEYLELKEYQYTLPTSTLTGAGGEFQYTNSSGTTFTGYRYYQIKIVLLSTNTSIVPQLDDIRGINLLV